MPGLVRLIVILTAGFLATVGAAAANEWKVYRYPQEGFAAEFPGVPRSIDMKAPQDTFVRGVQQLAKDDAGTEYMGQTLIYQPSVRKNNPACLDRRGQGRRQMLHPQRAQLCVPRSDRARSHI